MNTSHPTFVCFGVSMEAFLLNVGLRVEREFAQAAPANHHRFERCRKDVQLDLRKPRTYVVTFGGFPCRH